MRRERYLIPRTQRRYWQELRLQPEPGMHFVRADCDSFLADRETAIRVAVALDRLQHPHDKR